ncbi:hypothetical protein [Bacillus sp. OV166]|nr:hypothetical protein [Bacillus sp. OV166]
MKRVLTLSNRLPNGDKAEIAEIIIVGKREDNEVYQEAYKRLQELKRDS